VTHAAPDSPVRVLVVDDHADVRFLVRTILRDAGPPLEVAGEAAGADEALEAIEACEVDVVVLDALMPVVDGFEAARMILDRRPGLPIMLCSALVDGEVRARAEAVGIAACLSKDDFEAIPRVALELAGRAS
jgi:CheY-like chemotaxis protein